MQREMNKHTIESIVSTILRVGVIVSALIVFAGGAYYLAGHGREAADHELFVGQPVQDRLVGNIIEGVFQLRARSVIQFGILCLIATPIVRVAYSLIGFSMERDHTYVVITALVVSILLASLFAGAAGGV